MREIQQGIRDAVKVCTKIVVFDHMYCGG
jgi:hypothetical protein